MIHPSKNFIKMKWFLGKENIWKVCEQYNLGDKLRITCVEGYLENQNTFIEGYLTGINIGDYYNVAQICISNTLNEPIDGEYTWLAVDAVTDIEILERRKLSWEKKRMTEQQKKWAQSRIATKDIVTALIHDMEIKSKDESLPATIRQKAQRFLNTYNKDSEYYQFNKPFMKRLNKFFLEIYHSDEMKNNNTTEAYT